mmetsp:Transcript_19047/g.32402  ORF Transcript_19047/g.32402 Transcript_19047/m.32402 type:complete len:247 (+) Transcript_19047:494-1234(+)
MTARGSSLVEASSETSDAATSLTWKVGAEVTSMPADEKKSLASAVLFSDASRLLTAASADALCVYSMSTTNSTDAAWTLTTTDEIEMPNNVAMAVATSALCSSLTSATRPAAMNVIVATNIVLVVGGGDEGGSSKRGGGDERGGSKRGGDGGEEGAGAQRAPKHRRPLPSTRNDALEPTVTTPGVHAAASSVTSEPCPSSTACDAYAGSPSAHADSLSHEPTPPIQCATPMTIDSGGVANCAVATC